MTRPKPNGAAAIEPLPTARMLALIEQRAAIDESIEAEKPHARERGELAAFLAAHPNITRRDLLDAANDRRPRRGKYAVKSRTRMGFEAKSLTKPIGKVGKAINDGRRAKNLSKSQLASLCKTSNGTVANWEQARTKPSELMATRLARALGKPEAAFLPA